MLVHAGRISGGASRRRGALIRTAKQAEVFLLLPEQEHSTQEKRKAFGISYSGYVIESKLHSRFGTLSLVRCGIRKKADKFLDPVL